jgi:hypothetical protein
MYAACDSLCCRLSRLRQQSSPATPENSAAFGEKSFETVCFDSFILIKTGFQTDAQRLFKSFLTRNELFDSAFA